MSESSNRPESGDAILETRRDAGKGQEGVVKYWLQALEIASQEEKNWRSDAEETEEIYLGGVTDRMENHRKFNILYSNTETLLSAVYNSPPVPDVRRRYSDDDPTGKHVSTILERALSYSIDEYDIDQSFRQAVLSGLVPGRGMLRVRYVPTIVDDQIVAQKVVCESVDWRSFRRGPARRWDDVPWIAFRHYLSREDLKRLNPTIGAKMPMEATIPNAQSDETPDNLPDVFKRAEVWEIWDKERREVVFIGMGHKSAPLRVDRDPLGLGEFFPVVRPLQPIELSGSLVPVEPYRLYKGLAEELESLTGRAGRLIKALRWRGAYLDPQIGDFLTKFADLDDGEVAPIDNPAAAGGGGLDKAFWFQPVDQAAAVLLRVYEAREQTKQAIYEITGIADLLRGASVASETATAQNIKAQWGSLRVQAIQAEVSRMARDVLRLKAEIIAEKFEPMILGQMTGIEITPEIEQLLRSDPLRRYRVDVETDSTIRSDLQRQQQNISGFVQGFGSFIQAVGPAVQAGALPMPVVAEMIKSFSRVFKLGRAVEEAIDSIPTQAPQQPDPNQQAEQQAQAEQAKMQAEMQKHQMQLQAQQQMKQMEIEAAERKAAAEMQMEREKMAMADQHHMDQQALKQSEIASRENSDLRRFGLDQRVAEAAAVGNGTALQGEGQPSFYDMMAELVQQQNQIASNVQTHSAHSAQMAAEIAQALRAVGAPKRIIRDKNNRAIGVEPVSMN